MKLKKNISVVYHKNCPDGFSGAWTAWKKFGDKAEYIASNNREEDLKIKNKEEVYLIDFVFSKSILKKLLKNNKKLIIIDHHKTSKKRMNIANETIYNKENAGSVLAWKYFFPKKKIPTLLKYVEDVDLWNWKLKNTKEIFAIIDLTDYSFKKWGTLAKNIEKLEERKKMIKKGSIIVNSENKIINKILEKKYLVEMNGYKILVVNSPVFKSEIGHILASNHPPFGIIWHESNIGIKVSLRSDNAIDVSKIAEKYNGGGHKNAAGFLIKNNQEKPWNKI